MKIPSEITLKKYGLTYLEYADIFNRQEGVCSICGKPPKEGKVLNIDHVHVKGWKKMRPDQRKQYVRGILCYMCNRFYMAKAMTEDKAFNIIEYIQAYEGRNRGFELQHCKDCNQMTNHVLDTCQKCGSVNKKIK